MPAIRGGIPELPSNPEPMSGRVTAPLISAKKATGEKVVCITAYDFPTAKLADEAGVDLILVGDSLGSVLFGFANTIPVTIEMMLHHVSAASRGVTRALVIADLPFGSYQASVEDAVNASVALMKAGAGGVKLEGCYPEAIREIRRAGIPVMGHVGMTPQSYHAFGGHKIQGKGDTGGQVIDDAIAVVEAGAFAVVLELIPAELSREVTQRISVPTIGIGAGVHCDGQVQVFHDMLGYADKSFKHVKKYAEVGAQIRSAIQDYAEEVRRGDFPGAEQSF